MANFSRVHEEVSKNVGSNSSEEVIQNIPVKGYESVSLTVRSGSGHDFDIAIIREGYSSEGVYGSSDGGTVQEISSGGQDVATIPEITIESPEINVEITNNDGSSHDYDVFVGGQSR